MFIVRALYEKVSDLTFDPWRVPDTFSPLENKWEWKKETYQKLFRKIATTVPPVPFKDGRLNLLVIGPKSHGKSSFINAVASISASDPTTVANSGSGGESETVTTVFRHLDLPGDFKCFRLCDVSGLTKQESADTLVTNLKLLVNGHIKPGYKFEDMEPITAADTTYYISKPRLENKVHGVIIVFDITETYEIHMRHRNSVASITEKLHEMNMPISVVLTKADQLDPQVRKNIEKIYYSKRVLTAVENTTKWLGVPVKSIHPVVNFEDKYRFGWKNGLPILVAVRAIVSNATSHILNNARDHEIEADETQEAAKKKGADENKKPTKAEAEADINN